MCGVFCAKTQAEATIIGSFLVVAVYGYELDA
jgi:hypothetical protein